MKQKVAKYARKIINNANLVVSRDVKSAMYLKELCDKDIYVETDLAFGLPYNDEYATSGKLKVGINPSGLLCNKKNEKTDLNMALSADYDQYVLELINCLKERNFDIYLIPHVGEDGVNSFSEIEGVNTHPEFSNPIEAKSFISSMDIFIGARTVSYTHLAQTKNQRSWFNHRKIWTDERFLHIISWSTGTGKRYPVFG